MFNIYIIIEISPVTSTPRNPLRPSLTNGYSPLTQLITIHHQWTMEVEFHHPLLSSNPSFFSPLLSSLELRVNSPNERRLAIENWDKWSLSSAASKFYSLLSQIDSISLHHLKGSRPHQNKQKSSKSFNTEKFKVREP